MCSVLYPYTHSITPPYDSQQLEDKAYITRAEVQKTLDISQATAITLLRDMRDKSLLLTEGSGKKLRYKQG
jgi:predicted transcriptional regulator